MWDHRCSPWASAAIEETSKYVCDLDPHILKKAMTSLLGHPDPEVRKAVSQEMAKASAITENVNLDARKSPSEIAAEEKQDDEEHMSDAVPTDFEGEEAMIALATHHDANVRHKVHENLALADAWFRRPCMKEALRVNGS